MHIGRVISTGFLGLLFALFLAIDLVLFGVLALNSAVVTVLLVLGLVVGGLLGWLIGRHLERRPTTVEPTV